MNAGRRREGVVAMLAMTAGLLLAGCASGPAPLHQDEIDEVMAAYDGDDLGSLTVVEALALAPEGTIGMIDARSSSLTHDEHVSVGGMPDATYADWRVISLCGSSGVVPSVLLVALPPDELASFDDRPWGVRCDFTQYVDN